MGATDSQMESFERELKDKFDFDLLNDILEWIKENMEPVEVFGKEELKTHINDNFTPDEMFNDRELGEWAEDNSYILRD